MNDEEFYAVVLTNCIHIMLTYGVESLCTFATLLQFYCKSFVTSAINMELAWSKSELETLFIKAPVGNNS
jgi:hypothetical protein